MSRYFIKMAFDGTRYHGWQVQDNAATVQAIVEKGLSLILEQNVQVTGCGRTDAGVHAREFWAHFDVTGVDHHTVNALIDRLNRFLPKDIVVFDILPVHAEAHARFSAVSRTYSYYISRVKDPFGQCYSWYHYGRLDAGLMNQGARVIMGYDDFTSFSKLHTQVNTNICRISEAQWTEHGGKLVFTITADRFLRNMVRAIVGTLLELGRNKITLEDLHQIIVAKNRMAAGFSVPACGLFLERVEYPEEIFRIQKG
jgi:tRNA pseudouridine38-40 synthase